MQIYSQGEVSNISPRYNHPQYPEVQPPLPLINLINQRPRGGEGGIPYRPEEKYKPIIVRVETYVDNFPTNGHLENIFQGVKSRKEYIQYIHEWLSKIWVQGVSIFSYLNPGQHSLFVLRLYHSNHPYDSQMSRRQKEEEGYLIVGLKGGGVKDQD